MKIVALEEDKMMLKNLLNCIHAAMPSSDVFSFSTAEGLLKYVKEHVVDAVFMDVKADQNHGIEIAKELKALHPHINIIFTVTNNDYAFEAFRLRASGYIEKPVTVESVREELENLRYHLTQQHTRISFKCFGNFEAFYDNTPIVFKNAKTKELLAYLVDRSGSTCTTREIMSVLWEDGKAHDSYFKKIRKELITKFEELGCLDILNIQHGGLGINIHLVKCDYYDLKQGIIDDTYITEYMSQYSWGTYHSPF